MLDDGGADVGGAIGDFGQAAEDGSVRGKGKGKMRTCQDKKSIFSLGSDEEHQSSGSDDNNKKEGRLSERQRRGRSISTGRTSDGGPLDQPAAAELNEFALETDSDASESDDGASSGSECATPTPESVSRGRQGQAKTIDPTSSPTPVVDLRGESSAPAASEDADGGVDRVGSSSNIPGIAPRMRRGVRGPAGARRVRSGLAFDIDIHGFTGDIEVADVSEGFLFLFPFLFYFYFTPISSFRRLC